MNDRGIISRWAILFMAEVLNLSASVAEKLLMGQPRWLAQLRLLEENLRVRARPAARNGQDDADGEVLKPAPGPTRQLLESYAILNRALVDIEARGLSLDDTLIGRMESEWNAKSIVGYLRTSDMQLRQGIGETLLAAATALGAGPVVTASQAKKRIQKDTRKSKPNPVGAGKIKTSSPARKDLVT